MPDQHPSPRSQDPGDDNGRPSRRRQPRRASASSQHLHVPGGDPYNGALGDETLSEVESGLSQPPSPDPQRSRPSRSSSPGRSTQKLVLSASGAQKAIKSGGSAVQKLQKKMDHQKQQIAKLTEELLDVRVENWELNHRNSDQEDEIYKLKAILREAITFTDRKSLIEYGDILLRAPRTALEVKLEEDNANLKEKLEATGGSKTGQPTE